MKHTLFIMMLICFAQITEAQDDYYSKQWKQVEALENDGKTKSAAELVNQIYLRAKTDNSSVQRVKSLLFKSKYLQILEEDALLTIVENFKKELNVSDLVTRHILENMLATMYWNYFKQNRYRFYNRSHTEVKINDDFRTWDLKTLFEEIHTLYQKSLENGLLLQQEQIEDYKVLLLEEKGSKAYRPTLFDILSHNALEFYKTDENNITQPAYQFKVSNTNYLANHETFINLTLESKDSLNLQLNTLKIYQKLLRFHRKDITSKAFVTNDIDRLNFVYTKASLQDKDELLLSTLRSASKAIERLEFSALYQFAIAKVLKNQGTLYIPNLQYEANRYKIREALDICNAVIETYPNSDAAKKCSVLKNEILHPSFQIRAEAYIPTEKPSRVLISYKNLNTLDFSIFKISKTQLTAYNKLYRPEEKKRFFSKLKAVHNWWVTLKDEHDFQNHSTEVEIPNLQNGIYLIKADTNVNDVFSATSTQVTNLALIETNTNDAHSYQIIDRNNGKPIKDATIEANYRPNYNQAFITKSFVSDATGHFTFQKNNTNYYDLTFKVIGPTDTGYFGDYYINRSYNNPKEEKPFYNTHLFTDRSIYRPGQTLYFKGIVTKTFKEKTSVVEDNMAKVSLHNVNGEELSSLDLVTNDFGSFHGEFIIPNSGLTGLYSIRVQSKTSGNGFHNISIEEYKRPKFEAKFLPVSETFKVNQTVTVKGEALAFAGSSISNAKVTYRVKRVVRMPRWYYWSRSFINNSPQEITFGETLTDANGKFEIKFKALPDDSINPKTLPIFEYEVTTDITDINGETRSTSQTLRVGYHTLLAIMEAPTDVSKDSKELNISIDTKNLNGEFIAASGSVNIYKLIAPETVLRSRPWSAPDYQEFSEEAFKSLFPHDPYTNEDQKTNWDKGKKVFESKFNTETSKEILIKKFSSWESGWYILELESMDAFGQTVTDKTYINLYSNKDTAIADNQLFDAQFDKDYYKPGDTAILTIGSATSIYTTVRIEKENKTSEAVIYHLNNSKQHIEIPVTVADLGGFVIHYHFAAFNDYTGNQIRVHVPYPKTDLNVQLETFRDKLQPAQEETWSFNIKGPKGDKVVAEILASMYDMSLDQFKPHTWRFNPLIKQDYYSNLNTRGQQSFNTTTFAQFYNFNPLGSFPYQSFDRWNWFGFYFGNNRMYKSLRDKITGVPIVEQMVVMEDSSNLEEVVVVGYGSQKESDEELESEVPFAIKSKDENGASSELVQIRKNLKETAFFFPQLQTDKDGNVRFSFKAPEALTKWKLQLLAHTKSLESSVAQFETVTQKELMVLPNVPRFLREGDRITISTKISNLTDSLLAGYAEMVLKDPINGKIITNDLLLEVPSITINKDGLRTSALKSFSTNAKGNTQVTWQLQIPEGTQAVEYTITAKSGHFSDGELGILPILSNRMLVTETLPMWIRSNETRTFTLDKLKTTTSSTLKHHKLTLEMSSNPAWYAVQALPYLMEYPYECNEQTFARYYSNALAQHIVSSNPKIETMFKQWSNQSELQSALEKNQELKQLVIEETPWLRDANTEAEQKKRIGLLFDLNHMSNELSNTLRKLKNNQLPSGAWPWFNGGRPNRYITQHIILGFGHLQQLGISLNKEEKAMVENALRYLDTEFVKEYKDIRKYDSKVDLTKDHLSYIQMHYLYTRSFFQTNNSTKEVISIQNYYLGQIDTYWLKRSLYAKGLMALVSHRANKTSTASKIWASLKENSITSDELGMYWKENSNSLYWYQAPIETQALLIEVFAEVGSSFQSEENHLKDIDNLKIWLLKNKQTNQWKTTKATTEAVYALLLQGTDWLDISELVDATVGNEKITREMLKDSKIEAGTGYYKTSWMGSDITPEKATVTISKSSEGIAWGALYWQYFEDLDNITSAETPLKLSKKLFKKINSETGGLLTEIHSDSELKVGDLIRVRIELRSDRTMEFVHLKDMRASGLEPINVLSQYKWQDGLGYYESTRDAATNFFIDYLPKGVFVFEYDLRVNNKGHMSNGVTSIQSMYAPEFSSHSEGIRLKVE